MAGDWMKVEKSTPEKPEIEGMASILGIDPDAVFGKLFRVWSWFDDHTLDGNAPCVTSALLDRKSCVTGFADAMAAVGWLVQTDDGLILPHFDRHNGETAKRRALTAKRVAKSKSKSNAPSVTSALPREEKRREENNRAPSAGATGARTAFAKPTESDLVEYAASKGLPNHIQGFTDHYESNGWRVGRNPMKDWRAAYRNWCKRQGEFSRKGGGQAGRADRNREAFEATLAKSRQSNHSNGQPLLIER